MEIISPRTNMGDTIALIDLKQEDKDVDVDTSVDMNTDVDMDANMIARQGSSESSYPLGNRVRSSPKKTAHPTLENCCLVTFCVCVSTTLTTARWMTLILLVTYEEITAHTQSGRRK